VVGRPALYSTTALFLEYFGLRSLEDLPAADELRRIVIEKPAAPLTDDPGLATVPPEQLQVMTEGEVQNSGSADAGQAPAEPSESKPA
ncbi:MAG TPA: SMC-Scp complex subunit ScpB, partial [Candidatus Paceibacterota bacterium]|nr:SMC-Scp complex subunit ScpB [Candidatus Paceibacterota bacterium]